MTADATNGVLAGRVIDSVTGQPVAGAAVTVEGRAPVTSDSDGRWRVEAHGASQARLWTSVLASGFVPRETSLYWRPEGRQNIDLELLPERAPFALSFYRYLVRNGLEEPGSLQPVRRWTTNPNFYIQTDNPKTGGRLEPREIDLVIDTIRQALPQLTGGALNVGAIDIGDGPRAPRSDYINVMMIHEPSEQFCGRAFVGANPGEIQINYDNCTNSCRGGNMKIPPAAVAHELGHALGFWHVDKGIMAAYMSSDCANVQFSEPERIHARVAYRRPSGNTDPDRDPTDFSAVVVGGEPRIACPMPTR